MFKHAPTAENADSKSKPETKVINKRITKKITYIEKKPQIDVATWSSTLLVPIFNDNTEFGWIIFIIFLYAWFNIIKTLHDLTPPPTEPEQAPIKAPINNKNDIEKGQSVEFDIEKPVVVSMETLWNNISLDDGELFTLLKVDSNNDITIISNNIEKKNLSSGS